jgi:hypothetical protein
MVTAELMSRFIVRPMAVGICNEAAMDSPLCNLGWQPTNPFRQITMVMVKQTLPFCATEFGILDEVRTTVFTESFSAQAKTFQFRAVTYLNK